MKDIEIKKILDTIRGSNLRENNPKFDKPPNVETPFGFNSLQLELTALKYYELVTLKELSELEAKQLDKILEQAETDDKLSLLLNEVDELTFEELGFYEKDSLEQVENLRAKAKEFIIKLENYHKIDCIDKLQSICSYQNILNEYYRLITLKELSELETRQLDKILEQAETDDKLSLLLNEVDELTFEELGFYEKDSLEQIENQKSEFKKCIERILNQTNDLTSNQVHVRGAAYAAGHAAGFVAGHAA
ncbi:hypothetical protein, partial [Myxosarcina sp. GI1]|uniref:hypothetical protein n=1 Tax=Myxosarcina sp. GI1 TaxID=1541065 RepID=UPI000568FFEE